MAVPEHAKYLIVGAGVHGLSTAYHLSMALKGRGNGSGRDILVLDKSGIGAGASGIACGVIRNNYFQPAMRELMAHSVEVWESDPKAFSFHPVGYMQISPEVMREDVARIYEEQKAIGYPSTFVEGREESLLYMRDMFHDWQAEGITSVLHEMKGGYANNVASMTGLAGKAEAEGVRVISGIEVTGFQYNGGAVSAVETNSGVIRADHFVVGVGPWVPRLWDMLDLPKQISIKGREGEMHDNVPMWTYWCLQEGTLGVDPSTFVTNDGRMPPVIHVDSDAPLHSVVDDSVITDEIWGIYYKPDFSFNGVQGGAMPYRVDKHSDEVAVDPYGPESPEFVAGEEFAEMWCSALAFCHERFEGEYHKYRREPSGGIGAFTPDSFPVIDVYRQNVHIIADSNHGYKMIGVGKLIADELLGRSSVLLEPFRFSRYANGRLHPVSHSPFPWS